jgi:hypothetical protein
MDVLFNFAATALTHDSWLRQMHIRGWPMVYPFHPTRMPSALFVGIRPTIGAIRTVSSGLTNACGIQRYESCESND